MLLAQRGFPRSACARPRKAKDLVGKLGRHQKPAVLRGAFVTEVRGGCSAAPGAYEEPLINRVAMLLSLADGLWKLTHALKTLFGVEFPVI